MTPIDIAGWGVTVRKSVAEYEVETACACGFVFSGETPEGRQHAGFAGALAINAHVAELNGLAQAFILGRDFVDGAPSALVLGDNIFYGHDLAPMLAAAAARTEGATVFAYHVDDPQRYGVVEFDAGRQALSIEEKPQHPRSAYAVTGLYFYDGEACDIAAGLRPSARGELEITDLNNRYLERQRLRVEVMGRGFAWLDTGTHDALLEAAQFIATLERRQGLKVACPEELAYRAGWISAGQLHTLAEPLAKTGYGEYLRRVLVEAVY